MMGISYGAISQLFTAQLDPPDLEAISPLSTIDATATTLYPGGILNTGFAVAWAQQRQAGGRARRTEQRAAVGVPADPERRHDVRGQPGAPRRGGRPEREDRGQLALRPRRSPTRSTRSPSSTRSRCRCSWRASGRTSRPAATAPTSSSTSPAPSQKWFTFTNGAHIDSLDPDTFNRWYDFLELFVAHQAPIVNAAVIRAAAPVIYQPAMGLPQTDAGHAAGRPDPADPDLRARRWPRSRSCPRSGCCSTTAPARRPPGPRTPGDPYPGFEQDFSSLPDPRHHRAHLVPRAGRRARATSRPTSAGHQLVHLERERAARSPTIGSNTGTGGLWGNASQWQWNWQQNPSGTAVSYVSAPLTANTDGRSAPAPCTSGCARRLPTSTCRPRSARCVPTATRRSCRTAGSAPASASSSTGSNNMFKQPSTAARARSRAFTAADASPMPAGQFVKVVDPALLRGPRVPRRVAHPGDDLRAERHAAGVVVRPDGARAGPRTSRSRSRSRCRRASSSRSFPA